MPAVTSRRTQDRLDSTPTAATVKMALEEGLRHGTVAAPHRRLQVALPVRQDFAVAANRAVLVQKRMEPCAAAPVDRHEEVVHTSIAGPRVLRQRLQNQPQPPNSMGLLCALSPCPCRKQGVAAPPWPLEEPRHDGLGSWEGGSA